MRIKIYTLLAFIAALIYGCNDFVDADFGGTKAAFIAEYTQLFPDESALAAENNNLHRLHLPTPTLLDSVAAFYAFFSKKMETHRAQKNAPEHRKDYEKMANILKNVGNYSQNRASNPRFFDVRAGFQRIFLSDFLPKKERFALLFDKMKDVSAYYDLAKNQLQQINIADADRCIEAQVETYLFFDKTLRKAVIAEKMMTPQYLTRLNEVLFAIKDYIAYVESARLQ